MRHKRFNRERHNPCYLILNRVIEADMLHAEDVLSVHNELDRGAPFCANPSCDLHVRLIDQQVEGGGGNWVSLPDGRVFGRGRYAAGMLCDACGTRRGPVRLDTRRLRLAR